MEINKVFKKIPWIYEMPEVLTNGVLLTKRLDELSEDAQKELVYMVVNTLSEYFGQVPANYVEISKDDPLYSEKFAKSLSNMLPIWLNGLCDVSVAQIISALLDILNLKTEYQKWPPKSVIEFHAVCKIPRPAYHDAPTYPSNVPRLSWDKDAARETTVKTAHECLIKIYKQLKGKDYLEIHEQRKKEGFYGKKMQEEWCKEQEFKKVEGK